MTKTEIVIDIMTIVSLLLSISVHEWAHAKTADFLGDDTPRSQGRVTLTPWVHWDPLGTVLMIISTVVGFGIGWGKPVYTDYRRYTRVSAHVGRTLVAAAGPLSNLVIAVVFGLGLRFDAFRFDPNFTGLWALVIVSVNLALFLFNLIPAPPLDGSKIILAFFPVKTAEYIESQYRTIGPMLLIIILVCRIPSLILQPGIEFLMGCIIGR